MRQFCGGTIEGHVVDNCTDDDTPSHELADGIGHVLIVASQTVNPTDH